MFLLPAVILLSPWLGEREPVWVFFVDRGVVGAELDAALVQRRTELSPRALARRRRVRGSGQEIDPRDLAPHPAYVEAVVETGVTLRSTSRWLNAVGVWGTPGQRAAIADLPFVRKLRPVAGHDLIPTTPEGPMPKRASVAPEDEEELSEAQLQVLHIPRVHACGLDGDGVVVGLLDSGFVLSHAALAHLEVLGARDFVNDDDDVGYEVGDDATQADHGTMVLSVLAGEVAGRYTGAAPGVSVLLAKTEDMSREVHVEEDWFVEGLEWLEASGADMVTSSVAYGDWYTPEDMDGETAVTTRAVGVAVANGLILFQSMGNAGPEPTSLSAPADAVGVVSVGSVYLNGRIAHTSSRGPTADGRIKPDLVAPGVGVWMARPGTMDAFRTSSGTSFATPLAAGVGALILQATPTLDGFDMVDALHASATRLDGLNNDTGWGLVDAWAALGAHCCANTGDCGSDECDGGVCVYNGGDVDGFGRGCTCEMAGTGWATGEVLVGLIGFLGWGARRRRLR